MSKVKVDQIESSDNNVKIAGKGTGVVKVKASGGTDAAIQLSSASGAHGVKIKSPSHSAGQSHTLTLPDNNIEQGKFLKIKSITGSGDTAVGQLEYASIASPDLTQMDGSHFTSGSIPSARFNTAFNGSSGGGYTLVSTTDVTTDVYSLDFTFDDNSSYYLIGKNVTLTGSTYYFTMDFLAGDGVRTLTSNLEYTNMYDESSANTEGIYSGSRRSQAELYFVQNVVSYRSKFSMHMEICTRKASNFVFYRCIATGQGNAKHRSESTICYNDAYQFLPLHGIRLRASGYQFTTGTKFLLYKHGET